MGNKRLSSILLFLFLCVAALAALPYATIEYAEGNSFMLIRGGKTRTVSVDSSDVFGMELRPGDIIQTAASTFLEITIHSVSASVQVAENTSFRCDSDAGGNQVSGELYYGRIRAKVKKLAGASSFRISTPSLVAGVRGTEFGCDVIAVLPPKTDGTADSNSAGSSVGAATSMLNRVFCLEGSVAVADTSDGSAEPILIVKNEMVETIVAENADHQASDSQTLLKSALSPEVDEFWRPRPFTDSGLITHLDGGVTVFSHKWPAGREEKSDLRNLTIPGIAVASLFLIGSATCIGTGWYRVNVEENRAFPDPAYSAGLMMVGSGSILALITTLFN